MLRHIRRAHTATSNLAAPCFPVAEIAANADLYAASVQRRRVKLNDNRSVGDIVGMLQTQRRLRSERQRFATEQNKIGSQIKQLLAKQNARDAVPTEELRLASAKAKQNRAEADKRLVLLEKELASALESVPNLMDPRSAAISENSDFVEVGRFGGTLPKQTERNLKRDHVEIGLRRGLLDIEAASRVSGTGNVYLVGNGALLERALVAYAMEKLKGAGFSLVSPPTLVRPEFVAACGFRPREDVEDTHIYETDGGTLALTGTAEIPLVSMLANRELALPPTGAIKRCAVSRCFRREAGSRGADTRGLYRLHEFTKVEMVAWTEGAKSCQLLEELVMLQREILEGVLGDIGTPLRVINVAPHDLGAPAYMKYDIEAFMPGRGSWGELSSASNCTDFQSRRLHTRLEGGAFAHTLNATALAVPRVILAILENGYNEEKGMVRVPKVLRKWLDLEYI